jgi:hypothetical protein
LHTRAGKKVITLHSDAVTAPKHPMGSVLAPLDRKKSRTSKFVRTPAFAFSLQNNNGQWLSQSSNHTMDDRQSRTFKVHEAVIQSSVLGVIDIIEQHLFKTCNRMVVSTLNYPFTTNKIPKDYPTTSQKDCHFR